MVHNLWLLVSLGRSHFDKPRLTFNFSVAVLNYTCVSNMHEGYLVAINLRGNPGMSRTPYPSGPAKQEDSDVTRGHDVAPGHNRLTFLDRRQAASWASGPAAALCRLQIYDDPDEDDEIGDFISIYRPGENWASWCVARRGNTIAVWEAKDGKDLGSFPTVIAALHATWTLVSDPLTSLRASSQQPHMRNR